MIIFTNLEMQHALSNGELNELRRWSTGAVCNGWEQITQRNIAGEAINLEPVQDFMPFLGVMAGYAVTVVIQPSDPVHKKNNPRAWSEYRRYVASVPGPKIVVVQDLDKPRLLGAFWGEVSANFHRSVGCIGTIIDGGIRDVDEMGQAGFKALARALCPGRAHSCPIRWGGEVEVFGRRIVPGQLIHADKHGFLAIPPGDEPGLLEATRFMDAMECQTVIVAARDAVGKSTSEICDAVDLAGEAFRAAVREKFGNKK
jgi:4-hydroxy-4-methyl-2-oxoglutarate aldolase